MWKFRGNDRGLQSIQPEIPTDDFVMIFRLRTVRSKHSQTLCAIRVAGYDHATVAGGSEVFRGEERKASVMSDRSRTASLVFRTDSLRGIFNHNQFVVFRQGHDGFHVSHLPVKMHRDDC